MLPAGTIHQGARLLALLVVVTPLPADETVRRVATDLVLLGIAAVVPPACALAAYAVAVRRDWRAAGATIPLLLVIGFIEILVASFSWHLAVLLYALLLLILPCEIWRRAEQARRLPLVALSVVPTVVIAALLALAFGYFKE